MDDVDTATRRRAGRVALDLVVVVGAAAFVLWAAWDALAPSSVWIDDAWVVLAVKAQSFEQLVRTMVTAHGFTVLLFGWLRWVGIEGIAPQVLPLVFAMVAPGALWLGLRRWARWPIAPALLAAGMVATSPLIVVYATRVKQYTLDVLLTALLVSAALAISRRPTLLAQWLLVAGGLLAIVLSAATASVAGAAVLVVAVSAGRGWRTSPWRDRLVAAAPVAVFTMLALLWAAQVLDRTVPDGMYTFWQDRFLPFDRGLDAVGTATLEGFTEVADVVGSLPSQVALGLAGIGAVLAAVTGRFAVAAMVALPTMSSLLLAALQRAPWGGGRTESHLVVVLAVGLAAVLLPATERPASGETTFLRSARVLRVSMAGTVAGLLVAVGALSLERPSYPQEDLRPMLVSMEVRIQPGEVILVYPFARLAYALYTPADVTFTDNPDSSVGYSVSIDDERVRLLPSWRRDPTRYVPVVADLVDDDVCGVWLPVSHGFGEDLRGIKAALQALEFVQLGDHDRTAPGASLSHWRRRGDCLAATVGS